MTDSTARPRTALESAERLRAERAGELKALTDRHAWLLANAAHPVLHALIEAHGPDSDSEWPDCRQCPDVPNNYGDSDLESWPCPVWSFVSDRMEDR